MLGYIRETIILAKKEKKCIQTIVIVLTMVSIAASSCFIFVVFEPSVLNKIKRKFMRVHGKGLAFDHIFLLLVFSFAAKEKHIYAHTRIYRDGWIGLVDKEKESEFNGFISFVYSLQIEAVTIAIGIW